MVCVEVIRGNTSRTEKATVGVYAERVVCFNIINQDKGGQGMKKLAVVCLVLVFGAFTAGAVFANPSYSVQVTNSKVFAVERTEFQASQVALQVLRWKDLMLHLILLFRVRVLFRSPRRSQEVTGMRQGGGNLKSPDPPVRIGILSLAEGPGNLRTQWTGTGASIGLNPYFAATNTFNNVYGKWYENNAHVWTYFGLYFPPPTLVRHRQTPTRQAFSPL